VIYYIYSGSELLGFVYKNKTYCYHKNMFGDIIGIIDSSYNEIVTYEYDSWGALVNITDNSNINLGIINPFRYRSYYYDNETKIYYLNSRYYNPKIGRFINIDSGISDIGENTAGYNLFEYAFNNPISFIDESGDWPKLPKWVKTVAVAAVGVVVATATVAIVASVVAPGAVVATIAVGAAKGAAIGLVAGAAVGAVGGAVYNRVKTGSWKGSGEAALKGASIGALGGAIVGGIVGGVHATSGVMKSASLWDYGEGKTPLKNLDDHYKKHVLKEHKLKWGKNVNNYTDDAVSFYNQYYNESTILDSSSRCIKNKTAKAMYDPVSGKIRNFMYRKWR